MGCRSCGARYRSPRPAPVSKKKKTEGGAQSSSVSSSQNTAPTPVQPIGYRITRTPGT